MVNSFTDKLASARSGLPLFPDRYFARFDALARTFDTKRYPENLTNEDRKSLILHQLREAVALAPEEVDSKMVEQLNDMVKQFADFSAGVHPIHTPTKRNPPLIWTSVLEKELLKVAKEVREISGPAVLGAAWVRDVNSGIDLSAFPAISKQASESVPFYGMQKLSESLYEIGANDVMKWPQKKHAIQGAIDRYFERDPEGQKLQKKYAELFRELKSERNQPSKSRYLPISLALDAIMLEVNEKFHGRANDESRASLIFKLDCNANTHLNPKGRPNLENTDAMSSSVLRTVYAARWAQMARELCAVLEFHRALVNDPAIPVNLDSLALRETLRRSLSRSERINA